jgi:predicted membrane-bound spermidine synthase
MVLLIHILAFCGGFVIMSMELLGGRILAPYFGSGVYVWGSIITVFMLSLSLGYLLGGRLSVNNPSLQRFAATKRNSATRVPSLQPLSWRAYLAF